MGGLGAGYQTSVIVEAGRRPPLSSFTDFSFSDFYASFPHENLR